MKKITLKITVFDIVLYAFACIVIGFLTNYVGMFISQSVGGMIIGNFPNMQKWLYYTVAFGLLIPVFVLVPCLLHYLFFKYMVRKHYIACDMPRFWFKNMLALIIPGEVARFLVCLPKCGLSGRASAASTILFEFWLDASGRFHDVRQLAKFGLLDYFMFTVCYILIFAFYFAVITFSYKRAWNKIQEERDDLIIG